MDSARAGMQAMTAVRGRMLNHQLSFGKDNFMTVYFPD
jgi:hypothetical protein